MFAGEQADATRQALQDMIDEVPAGVVLYDRDERLTAFNTAAESMSGGVISRASPGCSFTELQHRAADISRSRGGPLTDAPAIRIARFRRRARLH